jgi:hypothetical protein
MKYSVFFVILENNKFGVIIGQNLDHPIKERWHKCAQKVVIYIFSRKEDTLVLHRLKNITRHY